MFIQLHGACRGHTGVVRYMYMGRHTDEFYSLGYIADSEGETLALVN